MKKTTCNVLFYESFPIEDIDQIVCSILESNDGSIIEEKIATILGFNVVDDFDLIPKRYADKAELEIFRAIVKPVFDWGLVDRISEKEKPIIFKITELGYRALLLGKKNRFYSGKKILLDNPNIKPAELQENLFFPFYSALGEYSEITSKQQIQYNKVTPVEVFDIEDTDLIKRHKLQSKEIYQINKSEITNYFSFESCQVDIRLFKLGDKYYPIIFYNNRISIEATDLLNMPENKNLIAKKIEWGLFLKLIKDPFAVLDYETIIPFEDLLELDSLIKDIRLIWSDMLLFSFIAERANANQWFDISNHCPIDVLKQYLQTFKDNLDWTSLSLRIDDDFLILNAIKYNWNFEAISAKEDIGIEVIKILLLIPELKEQEWDWDRIMPLLDSEFIKLNIDGIDFQLSELTKTNISEVEPLIAKYPAKRWDWTYISNEYELSFLLDNILNFRSFISVKNIINRAFVSENDINTFCKSDDFKRILLQAKDSTLNDYSPNQSKYIWTEQLIEFLETTGFLTWESGRFTSGFECNPYLDWTPEFFKQYHSRIATQKGFDYVSAHISDTRIVNEYPNFHWNWDILSANSNLITDFNFLLSVNDKLNFSILLTRISSSTLEVIFDGANILSYLESNHERWIEVTEKSSKEFVIRHIDYSWDWSILTRRFCSTIKIDALGNPKWIEKWDWKYLTQNLDLAIVTEKLNMYLERWDWEYLTRKLVKSFILNNLLEYNDYWTWDILLREQLEKQDLLLTAQLAKVASCVSTIEKQRRNELWKIITCKFDYPELEDLIAQTYNQDLFHWDFDYFYDLTDFNPRQYLNENKESVNWTVLSGSIALNNTFRWDKSLFNYDVWFRDVLKLLKNREYQWDFKSLSKLDNINWNDSILNIESEKWDWDYLSEYSSCFKKEKDFAKRFRKFSKFISFSNFSKRTDSEITEKFLFEYLDKDWNWATLSANNSINISFKFIKEHKDKPWDWQALSIRNDIEFDNKTLIELSNQNWNWLAISNRPDISFSEDLISSLYSKPLDWKAVSQNSTFVPNAQTLSLLKGKALDWSAISQNTNLVIEILWDYRDNLEWECLSKNEKFDISNIEHLNRYRDYLDWNYISQSEKFKASFENLKQFKDNLNWKSINNRIAINIYVELLEPFVDVLDWSNVSQSMEIHFTEELVEKYRSKWDWQLLRKNPQVIERLDTALNNYKAEFNSVEFLEQFHRTPYIYHFTHLFNAVDIIKERKILSRNKGDGKFANAAGNLVARRDTAHDYARFYFRPKTPTQFYNECLGWDNFLNTSYGKSYYYQARNFGLPKCPIPVFFKFDLKEVLLKMADKCYYSTGNMQTDRAKVIKVADNPNSLQINYLYDNISDAFSMAGGPYNYDRQRYVSIMGKIKEYSQQEFLILEEFDFSKSNSLEIICYNDEYVNLLKAQLGDDPICEKINANGWDIFHRSNRKLLVNETDNEISITSEYMDSAYLSIKGEGLKNIQILNPDHIQKETADEIIAYPEIKFIKTELPIEVHFVDPNANTKDWLVYRNHTYSIFQERKSVLRFDVLNDIINQFQSFEHELKLKLSKELFYPHMINSNHGIAHTTRVLFGSCILLFFDNTISDEIKKAIFYSAIIHDLGKTSDREGSVHGENSAKLYQNKIKQYILNLNLQTKILEAIQYHSVDDEDCPQEVQDNIIWKVLKDADALDRGRFNRKCDKSFLRLDIFKTELGNQIVEFMDKLPYYTKNLQWNNPYIELTDCIKQIN
ncbi:MAG TPA: DarT ssDNA thymidine ADP-ribosyltransferase family protein [Paludibacter sp.]